ncbi:hypothetical protein P7C70_g6466, partial [Phenoliferia sp. Uapishka_3]
MQRVAPGLKGLASASTSRSPRAQSTAAVGLAYERATLSFLSAAPLSLTLIHVGQSNDKGVDLRGWWPVPSSADPSTRKRWSVIAQCKAERSQLGSRIVRELEGTIKVDGTTPGRRLVGVEAPKRRITIGMLVSLSGFSSEALRSASSSDLPLSLVHLERKVLDGGKVMEGDGREHYECRAFIVNDTLRQLLGNSLKVEVVRNLVNGETFLELGILKGHHGETVNKYPTSSSSSAFGRLTSGASDPTRMPRTDSVPPPSNSIGPLVHPSSSNHHSITSSKMSTSKTWDGKSSRRRGSDDETAVAEPIEALQWTKEEERKIIRKLDWRVTGLLTLLFMLCFLDRANIGNAQTAGMGKDLNLTSAQFQWLLTIFYIGYITGQPATLLWKIVPANLFVGVLTLMWGGFALLQASTKNWEGMMVLRLFMGFAETAYSPGVAYFLSFFYNRREVGLRLAIFLGAAPVATAYAGALAYGITHIKGAGIADWCASFFTKYDTPAKTFHCRRILFLIEGCPAILVAPFVFFCLPKSASTASFLTPRERAITMVRATRDGNTGQDQKIVWRNVGEGLMDPKAWLQALMYFSLNVSYSSLPVFLPTILTEMGFTSIRAQGLTAPPYLASFITLVACAFLSDRWGTRSGFIIPLSIVGGVGYVVLATTTSTAVRYFAIYLCACGIFPVVGLMLPWVSNLHRDDSKRGAGFMLLNLVGQTGPLLGTRLYPAAQGPYYVTGMSVCAAFMFFVAILATILRLILIRENRKLDIADEVEVDDKGIVETVDDVLVTPFRYTL